MRTNFGSRRSCCSRCNESSKEFCVLVIVGVFVCGGDRTELGRFLSWSSRLERRYATERGCKEQVMTENRY